MASFFAPYFWGILHLYYTLFNIKIVLRFISLKWLNLNTKLIDFYLFLV